MGHKQPVEHYTDGRDSWHLGVTGFVTRVRFIVFSGLVTISSMSTPWWWPNDINSTYHIELRFIIALILLISSLFATASFYYLRKRSRRSLDIKYYLHRLAHDIRDRQTELHNKLIPGKYYKKSKLRKEIELLLKEVCDNISTQFQIITGDRSVSSSIRLAVFDKNLNEVTYNTFARSKGLNPQRKKTSEVISIKEGIARFLREEKNSGGILIYNNLQHAEKLGTYKMTENDRKYRDEICNMIVAPMNAWTDYGNDMIGILYITSANKKTFRPEHVDQVAFAADLAALAVVSSLEFVNLQCSSTTGGN